ncbi:hypothetical protein N656DRAFT_838565 [Canariomyces notabilis]|uniref:Aminoglycoside phosphotransferase domain-containing protein n=1 Tax=Canariomyces notabilis TaxID=2074819 RepID=A0AAN6QPT2_9PEZI|nr:hypothetical protein N656DRAFT_838565 [Canariomyces arenarius]
MPPASQDGLRWTETLFHTVPEWTRDPSIAAIEKVCRQQLSIPPEEACNVTFHTSGIFNKLYYVDCTNRHGRPLIIRVSLPVYPGQKTRAERMNGIPAQARWRAMSMEQKVAFTEQMAKFQAELSGFGKVESLFKGIGTLDFCGISDTEDTRGVAPGLLVAHEFFMGDRLYYHLPRGPFRSSHDWLSALLNFILQQESHFLKHPKDEDERQGAEETTYVAGKLLALVSKVCPRTMEEPEMSALYHQDLHLDNILVNEQGEITAVLDWECVSALPLWMSAKLPKFLEGPTREEEPQRDRYSDRDPKYDGSQVPYGLENNDKCDLYYEHIMEYEATQLRKVYKARLKELWPEWPVDGHESKIDLFEAISQCDGIWGGRVGKWAERIENGDTVRFNTINP